MRVLPMRKIIFVKPYSTHFETAKRLFDLYKGHHTKKLNSRMKIDNSIDKKVCTPMITIIGFEPQL